VEPKQVVAKKMTRKAKPMPPMSPTPEAPPAAANDSNE
jgi:hypothetical protein